MTASHAADGVAVAVQSFGQSLEAHGLAFGAKGHVALLWRRRRRRRLLSAEHGSAPQLFEEMSLRSMAYVKAHESKMAEDGKLVIPEI